MTSLLPVPNRPELQSVTELPLVPALLADLGEQATWRYVALFTANIRNSNTHRADARIRGRLLTWCEQHGLPLAGILPFSVPAYNEELQREASAPSVEQQRAATRMLCDGLVTGQAMPSNPASSVRRPRHVVKTGKTPVFEGAEWRRLINFVIADTFARRLKTLKGLTPYESSAAPA